jgi:hypothetical protein
MNQRTRMVIADAIEHLRDDVDALPAGLYGSGE